MPQFIKIGALFLTSFSFRFTCVWASSMIGAMSAYVRIYMDALKKKGNHHEENPKSITSCGINDFYGGSL